MLSPNEENSAIATITIQTDRKTRTYDVMTDVDEDTLKKNIGHLPSSALFGEEGLCVLMGHRDTDFSILQYVKIGDKIIIEETNQKYQYKVVTIEIAASDDELKFVSMLGSYLALVTCYPFKYCGHAPRKYVVTGKLILMP